MADSPSRPVLPGAEPFLLLRENRFAYEAVQRLAGEMTGLDNHPVFVYGPSGAGKSHLAGQFLRERLRENRKYRFLHMTAGEFSAQFAKAVDADAVTEYRSAFRGLNAFVLEDVQELTNRSATQRLFVALLDNMLNEGTRVLLTCHTTPGGLREFLPSLVNRFHGGICAGIEPPGRSSRISLITHFSATRQIPISLPVARHLAEHLNASPRELLAAVIGLDANARLVNGSIDIPLVERFLQGEVRPPAIDIDKIARAVAKHFAVTLTDVRSQARTQGLVLPRQCAMFLTRELTDVRLKEIGDYFGRRNHGTVLHACKRIREQLSDAPALRRHLDQIRQKILRNE